MNKAIMNVRMKKWAGILQEAAAIGAFRICSPIIVRFGVFDFFVGLYTLPVSYRTQVLSVIFRNVIFPDAFGIFTGLFP